MCLCAQLCLTLCDPMDCSPPDFSVHGSFQVRILEWVAFSFTKTVRYWHKNRNIVFLNFYFNSLATCLKCICWYKHYIPNTWKAGTCVTYFKEEYLNWWKQKKNQILSGWEADSLALCNQSLTLLKNDNKARVLLNSSPSWRYTRYAATHRENPSERNSETSWVMATHWANEKIPSLKQIGQLQYILGTHPTSIIVSYDRKGTPNSQIIPEEWSIWTAYLVLQLLRSHSV